MCVALRVACLLLRVGRLPACLLACLCVSPIFYSVKRVVVLFLKVLVRFFWVPLTLLGPQSRFGDTLLRICLVCPHNGTAVLKGLNSERILYTQRSSSSHMFKTYITDIYVEYTGKQIVRLMIRRTLTHDAQAHHTTHGQHGGRVHIIYIQPSHIDHTRKHAAHTCSQPGCELHIVFFVFLFSKLPLLNGIVLGCRQNSDADAQVGLGVQFVYLQFSVGWLFGFRIFVTN